MMIGDEIIIKNRGRGKLLLILGNQYLVELNGEKIKVPKDQITEGGETTHEC